MVKIAWKFPEKVLINSMKKNRFEIGNVVFGGIFEIWSKDGSTLVVVFQRLKFSINLKNPAKNDNFKWRNYREKSIKGERFLHKNNLNFSFMIFYEVGEWYLINWNNKKKQETSSSFPSDCKAKLDRFEWNFASR